MLGSEITTHLTKLMNRGYTRDETKLHDFEAILQKHTFQSHRGGLLNSDLVESNLIDHYIPFLPMEQRHLEQCILAEFKNLEKIPTTEMIEYETLFYYILFF